MNAPAYPLLISHARGWSLSEPYLFRQRALTEAEPGAVPGRADRRQLKQALAEDVGAVIALAGPELPRFLGRAG